MLDEENCDGAFCIAAKRVSSRSVELTLRRAPESSPIEAPSVPRHVRCLANGTPYDGEHFAYMIAAKTKNRKKDTFIGVSVNPWHQLYLHNSGNAKCRSTLCGAPWWQLVAIVGPFFTAESAESCAKLWSTSARGVDCKLRKAQSIATALKVELFSATVVSSETPYSFLRRHGPRSATMAYANLCSRMLEAKRNDIFAGDDINGIAAN